VVGRLHVVEETKAGPLSEIIDMVEQVLLRKDLIPVALTRRNSFRYQSILSLCLLYLSKDVQLDE
jgi:hypothetical protein